MDAEYDAIVLGAGHNGLILQAYLARAGLKTLGIDRRETAGGGLATVEYPAGSGYLHNTHSFYHRGVTSLPWYHDLELEQHGAHYIAPDLNVALITPDRQVLHWWGDFERTVQSVAQFSRNDAETLRRWCEAFRPVVQQILIPEAQSPPLPHEQRRALLQRSQEGRLLLEVSQLSPLEFVRREFEHPVVQAGLLFFNGLREVDVRCRGFGHHLPALFASGRMAQMCVGGSKRLAGALVAVIRKHGGDLLLKTSLRRILVENERAAGVETEGGGRIRARHLIASSLNPQQTLLDLIEPGLVPRAWADRARNFRYNLIAPLFSLNVNLTEPPAYAAAAEHPELASAFMVILGLDCPEQFEEIVRHHEAGTVPPPVQWGSCPTVFDASQAPAGGHTAFLWEKLPYRLNGNPEHWDAAKTALGRDRLRTWTRYAPNLEQAVTDWFSASPLDVERSLPNLREGDLLGGAFMHGQTGYDRPFPGAGHYRTHLPRLYLCGSCCHPGGNITGLPAYNCAQIVLRDLGIKAAWMPSREPV